MTTKQKHSELQWLLRECVHYIEHGYCSTDKKTLLREAKAHSAKAQQGDK